ncbi:Gfo/Idh/MocA family protein [Mesorhizobium sp. NBSH29]|uniref:Gfo/Idh/MocA family protein n=1 Tax=Mesorhizobium sp. NBSH29 TaxID=2654249 RepID=UPI0021562E6B|nr:Gfo/Idh/MocA family oxidoreductase [Mesorhizobium sp. NBSH29]
MGWGLVGTGMIARHFTEDLRSVAGAHLAAVTSRSFDKAAAFGAAFDARAHADLDAMLRAPEVDAVYIATPNDTHFSTALAALSAGKGVVVEKPLAMSRTEAEQLASFATEQKLFLMEGMWTRFLPAMDFVREALRSGAIGKVRRIDGELAFRHLYDPGNRFFDAAQGGGALLDLGVYLISLSLALMGRAETVNGRWRAAPSGVDMAADIEMTFGTAQARLHCALDYEGANLFVIEGTHGSLVLQAPFIAARQVTKTLAMAGRGLARMPGGPTARRAMAKLSRLAPSVPGLRHQLFDFSGYGLQFEIAAATQALAQGHTQHPLMPMADTVETLRIIETIRSQGPAA